MDVYICYFKVLLEIAAKDTSGPKSIQKWSVIMIIEIFKVA